MRYTNLMKKEQKIKTRFTEAQLTPLLEFGLTRAQCILYLTSLKYGILSVLELAKYTGINRQQIYTEAESMIKLGVYDTTRTQGRKYIAASPSKLVRLKETNIQAAQESLKNLADFVPELESLSSAKKYKTLIRHFEGLDRIKEAYEEELAQAKNTEVLSFAGSLEHHYTYFPASYWDKWNKQFAKQKSTSRMLAHDSETARSDAQKDSVYNRETRALTQFPLKVNIDVFINTVLIVSPAEETALWIESQATAESYRMLFNTLWQFAKPLK